MIVRHPWIRTLAVASLGLTAAWTSHAAAIPLDLSISGFASFDVQNLFAPAGNATQTGTLTRIAAGATTNTLLSGTNVAGPHPLAGSLSDIGDGFGVSLDASGSNPATANAQASISRTFGDLGLSLLNTSGSITYTIVLRYAFEALAEAAGTQGDDAFGMVDARLSNATTATDLGGTALLSDLLNGDTVDGVPTRTQGSLLVDSQVILLSVTLAPGAQVDLGDPGAELTIEGGAFDSGTAFATSGSLLLTIADIRSSAPPTPTPEPGTTALLALALGTLAWMRKRPIPTPGDPR